MKATETRQAQAEAKELLLRFLSPGDTVYTVLRHRSASGMSRHISLHVVKPDLWRQGSGPGIVDISGYVARFMGWRRNDKDGGIVVGGAGMDMGFHLVHNLSSRLFAPEDGSYSSEAAYSLRHEWI